MKEREQQAFLLRAKPRKIDRLPEALDNDQIIIGWAEVEGLQYESLSQDEFNDIFKSRYPDAPPEHMWRFIREMNIGDLVVVPSGPVFYVARILGPATYDKSRIEEDTAYRRKVEWLNNKKPIDRAKAKPGLYGTLGFQGTSCSASHRLKEIKECLNDTETNSTFSQAEENTMQHPLNTILYGPPGTGKTYDTVNYAVAVIEGKSVEVVKNENHKEVKNRFDKYRKEKQIEMVTFHQNYAYEDFIEGIRPVLDEEGEEDVRYELRKGIFREISDRATKNMEKSALVAKNIEKDEPRSETWGLDELLRAFAISVQDETETGEEFKLSYDDDRSSSTIKKVSWDKNNDFKSFHIGGSVTSANYILSKTLIKKFYKRFCEGEIKVQTDIRDPHENPNKYYAKATYLLPLFKRMREFHDHWIPEPRSSEEEEGVKNYVLIIDEINRGNIAKIFGELITLIEDSRRLGRSEATKVTLPYSGKFFGVPDNLYIIGTMNTADRSIALLDTALRRRFEFQEMMPDPSHQEIETDIDRVNLQELLDKMNERIRVLLDREHQIGHTYFLGVKDMDALKQAFQNKIIPLLQEYFYDSWEKIDLVLNQNGFINAKDIGSDLFKKSDLIDEQRKIYYEILSEDDERWKKPESYESIYTKSNKEQDEEQNQSQQ